MGCRMGEVLLGDRMQVRQWHAVGKAPTRGCIHCSEEGLGALCDLHI